MPDQIPFLWLQASQFDGLADGTPVGRIRDASPGRWDAVQTDPAHWPTVDASTGFTAVATNTTLWAVEEQPVNLGATWVAFVAGFIPDAGLGRPAEATWLVDGPAIAYILRVQKTSMTYRDATGAIVVPTVGQYDAVHLWAVRRFLDRVELWLDGDQVGGVNRPHPGNHQVVIPLPQATYNPRPGLAGTYEVRVYSDELTDAQFAAVTAAMLAAYGI